MLKALAGLIAAVLLLSAQWSEDYGVLLVLFIIFLPKGILGSLLDLKRPRAAATLERSPARSA
jgi:hypothetical protein